VSAEALDAALTRPDGRAYLIDLAGLRELVTDDLVVRPSIASFRAKRPTRVRRLVVAAAMVAGLAGGYAIGRQTINARAGIGASAASEVPAPTPTRVIEVQWQETSGGN
jgi:hypothetical protein